MCVCVCVCLCPPCEDESSRGLNAGQPGVMWTNWPLLSSLDHSYGSTVDTTKSTQGGDNIAKRYMTISGWAEEQARNEIKLQRQERCDSPV